MSMEALGTSLGGLVSGRLFTVYFLPVLLAAVSTVALLWARTPDGRLDGAALMASASATSGVQVALFLLAVLALSLLLQPVTQRVAAALYGELPALFGPVGAMLRRHELAVAKSWEGAAELAPDVPFTDEYAAQAADAYRRLVSSFPQRRQVGPTRLGNVLAAGADQVDAAYGYEMAALWPRLYPVLGDRMRSLVDDARDRMDAMCQLSIMSAIVGAEALALTWKADWWILLSLIPVVSCRLAYRGAVEAAALLSTAMRVAVDLHRFELVERLRLELPADRSAERELGEALSREWLQGVPPTGRYHHAAIEATR